MIEPIGKRVAFRILKEKEVRNGILIPDSAAPSRLMGQVLWIGPEVTQVEIGDRVYLSPMLVGHIPGVEFGETTVGFIQEDQILGIERGDTELELTPTVTAVAN